MPGFVSNYVWNLLALACGREPVRPLLVSWYVTHRCALACRYCGDGNGRPFKADPVPELDLAGAERLLRIVREATDTLDITGGEPLARTDLAALLALAKERFGFRTILNTKGIGLRQRPDVLKHLDVLVLSVDSLDAAELGTIMGAGAAEGRGVLDALAFALDCRQAGGPKVVLSSVAMPDSVAAVRQVLEYAAGHGLGFHFSPELCGTTVNPELRRSQPYRDLVDAVREHKRRGAAVLGIDAYLCGIRDFRRFRCHPQLMPVIRPDGYLLHPCLERPLAQVDLLAAGSWRAAMVQAQKITGGVRPSCGDECQIFCHMALSLAQQNPWAARREKY